MQSTKVPVGVSTLVGYSTSAVTLAGALAAFLTGDRSRDTLVIILLGAYSAGSFLVTQVGRFAQAHAKAKALVASEALQRAQARMMEPLPRPTLDPPGGKP